MNILYMYSANVNETVRFRFSIDIKYDKTCIIHKFVMYAVKWMNIKWLTDGSFIFPIDINYIHTYNEYAILSYCFQDFKHLMKW